MNALTAQIAQVFAAASPFAPRSLSADELADDHADRVGEAARNQVEARKAAIKAGDKMELIWLVNAVLEQLAESDTLRTLVLARVAGRSNCAALDEIIDAALFDAALTAA